MKQYLRKRQVAERYSVVPRSVERFVKDGRLPPPEYPLGPNAPMWDLDKLEANERIATTRCGMPDWRTRFLDELSAAATGTDAVQIVAQYDDLIDTLSVSKRERLRTTIQDIIEEKSESE